jgi:hypothetical protein
MAGEVFYEGAKPRYKGALHTEPRVERVWTRGKGWSSVSYQTGRLDTLQGQVSAAARYASQIRIVEGNGPFSSMEISWNGFNDGTQDDMDLEPKWGLKNQDIPKPLLAHETIASIDATKGGASTAISKAVQEFKAKPSSSIVNFAAYVPDSITRWAAQVGATAGQQASALSWFRKLVSGIDHFRVYQTIVTRTIVVSEVYSDYGRTHQSPLVYVSTDVFAKYLNPPATILSAVHDGYWLETPPEVAPAATNGRYQITQVWELLDDLDTELYTNLISV